MKAFALFLVCYLLASLLHADQLIIEPEMGREPLLKLMANARQAVHLAMYGFTDEKIRAAFIQKKREGLNVQVILEKSPYKNERENQKTIASFKKNRIPWRGTIKNVRLMHAKLLLLDKQIALLMTFNFTHSAFKQQRNFALLIDDPIKVEVLQNIFDSDWQNQTPNMHHADILVSPYTSRPAITRLLQSAEKNIRIYAQDISDPSIIRTLIDAAKRGVHIQILTTPKMGKSLILRLARYGITIRENTHYYVHAKIILVDSRKAVIGSVNLTRPSLDDNRELSMISTDNAVLQALDNTFSKDWQQETAIHNRVNWLYDPVARHKAWQMLKHLF